MVKKDASLAGRGVEILFGGNSQKQDEAANASSGDEFVKAEGAELQANAPAEVESPDVEGGEVVDPAAPIEPEWAKMLEQEAQAVDVEPTAEQGRPDWPAVTIDPEDEDRPMAPEPEAEMIALATTPIKEPAAPPAEAIPDLATTPIGMDEPAAVEPQPGETPAAIDGAAYTPPVATAEISKAPVVLDGLPAPRDKSGMAEMADRIEQLKLSGALYDTGLAARTGKEIEPDSPEMADLTPQDIQDYEKDQASRMRREKEVIDYVGFKQRQALWDEINALYDQVPQVLSTSEDQKDALRLLQESQDILMEKPRQYDIAKYKVSQVRTILERRKNIDRWTGRLAWGIFIYDILWICVLFYLVFLFNSETVLINALNMPETLTAKDVLVLDNLTRLWATLLWGAIGGVINGFYGLYKHVSQKQDFDKRYMMWYIAQPVIGFLLGGIIHLILGTGVLSSTGLTMAGEEVEVPLFPSLVACIAGFRQEFVLQLIDVLIRWITPGQERPN